MWMSEVVNVWGGECLGWWTSEVVNVWGGERLILHWGWWTSGVVNVWFYTGGGERLGWWMSGWWRSYNRQKMFCHEMVQNGKKLVSKDLCSQSRLLNPNNQPPVCKVFLNNSFITLDSHPPFHLSCKNFFLLTSFSLLFSSSPSKYLPLFKTISSFPSRHRIVVKSRGPF